MARRTHGFTLLEVTVSVSILSVLFLALFATLIGSSQLSTASSEDAVAIQQAQNQIETMKAVPFGQFYGLYGAAGTAAWSGATPTSGGMSFTVSGLGPGATGKIYLMPESAYQALTGQWVDLDFNGAVTTSVKSTYAYFPVMVTVSWKSGSNNNPNAPPRTQTVTSAIFNNPGVAGNGN
jgi:prepilin-type N-terminal cleavage/methylation domain-containing protein